MLHRPLGVIFDMDGLMLDTEPIYRLAWRRAAAHLGYSIDDDLCLRFVGRRNEDAEALLLDAFGATFPLSEFRARWVASWRDHVTRHGIPTKPGLLDLLGLLDRLGVRKGVATSTRREETELSLRLARVEGRFDCVVTGDEIAVGKPAPDIFVETAQRLGVPPERCVAFEDSDAGVVAASDAGIPTILVPDLVRPSDEAVSRAHLILRSLEEAPRLFVGDRDP